MIIYVDIDGTICNEHPDEKGNKDYKKAEPFQDRIAYFNELYCNFNEFQATDL